MRHSLVMDEDSPQMKSANKPLRSLSYGLCMGIADAVPGVSGGTIALILGFYDQFIDSLAKVISIVRAPLSRDQWLIVWSGLRFLLPLACGIICALVAATKLLVGKVAENAHALSELPKDELMQHLADAPPQGLLLNPNTAPYVFAVFFGLVLFSILQPWKLIKHVHPSDYLLAILGALAVASVSLSNPASLGIHPLVIIFSGMLAISVMLLPGISGSLVLLIIGMYQPISQALSSCLSHLADGNMQAVVEHGTIVTYFILGIIFGILSFVPILKLLLSRYHDRSMAILTGFMCGSLVALWPWKTHYIPKFINSLGPMLPQWPSTVFSFVMVLLCMLLGVLGILLLSKLAKSKEGIV
ncbi:MAG: DUF368 domain-containing protein [Planctomycetes bacterium]|nr:DUF368 domain-containing protein [Planctomycetota bacterium]